ncbi:hypothetical protein ES332_A12G074300v1 [Gossypium tomentosum]|uniref:Protein kinase domain-containing protein n=1 Tax=Gossypium tomentosum TaxID=34277 RepID=A0A5D2MUH1_GOSTO|nr:hypothetical protein ES332_A12G074300v1 [Gossypium tomentosum]
MSFLRVLNLLKNSFYNQIPQSIGGLRRLETLYLTNNSISGEIPSNLSSCSKLTIVRMAGNRLTGEIPAFLGFLSNLKVLSFYKQQFEREYPTFIGFFDIRENKIQCTLYTDLAITMPYVEFFSVRGNKVSGQIPISITNASNLDVLQFNDNRLSGKVPSLEKLDKLSTLQLAVNGLGHGREENLKNLGQLYVSQNRLSGLLPKTLGSCVSLEKLYLDGNLLKDPIPSSLSSLRGLEALDVSNNNLSGVIPSGGIFKNASATFVEGNSKLCGGIPELHMLRCNLKTSSSNSLRLKVAIIVVTLGVTLAFTCLLILWIGKKKEKQATATSVENSVLQLSYQSIVRATDGFSTQNLVGSGSFGSVYKGVLEASGAVIAVKVLNLLNRGASRSFLAECEALKNIRHRNLVKVLTAISGVDYQGNDFKALVYEFMENGSLEDWLHPLIGMNGPETARNLNFFQRVSVAIDVAHALQYRTIIVKNQSFIVTSSQAIFYLMRKCSLGLRGTIGYAPPEYGMGSELSTKGDVYSYGILLLEMFTGKRPIDERFREGLSLHNFVKAALPERIIEITDPNLVQERVRRGTPNVNNFGNDWYLQCLNSLFEIGLACSAESPNERIDMSDVATKLCSIKDKLHSTRLPS